MFISKRSDRFSLYFIYLFQEPAFFSFNIYILFPNNRELIDLESIIILLIHFFCFYFFCVFFVWKKKRR